MLLTVWRANVFVQGHREEVYKIYSINVLKGDLHPDEKDLGCHAELLPKVLLLQEEDYDDTILLVKGPFASDTYGNVAS